MELDGYIGRPRDRADVPNTLKPEDPLYVISLLVCINS